MLITEEQIGDGSHINFAAARHREHIFVCFGLLENLIDLSVLFDQFLTLLLFGLDQCLFRLENLVALGVAAVFRVVRIHVRPAVDLVELLLVQLQVRMWVLYGRHRDNLAVRAEHGRWLLGRRGSSGVLAEGLRAVRHSVLSPQFRIVEGGFLVHRLVGLVQEGLSIAQESVGLAGLHGGVGHGGVLGTAALPVVVLVEALEGGLAGVGGEAWLRGHHWRT